MFSEKCWGSNKVNVLKIAVFVQKEVFVFEITFIVWNSVQDVYIVDC